MSENKTEVIVSEGVQAFELAQRRAMVYAKSSLVPIDYRGEGNLPNVMIAMDMAHRMDVGLLQVMQSLYIVHGKPGWSSQFLVSRWNTCGKFSHIKYRFNEEQTECVAWATEHASGEVIEGPKVSIEMAKKEGWYDKKGSKWQTMPGVMLRYRAATFLIRTTAPELAMCLYEETELEDIQESN